jgi:hypothetical protein
MLPKLADNMAERHLSPYYTPAPWGDRELGEILDTGDSLTRRKRLARKYGKWEDDSADQSGG